MRRLSLLAIVVLVGVLAGRVGAVPDCWQVNSGFCINNDECDHWVEFDADCISGLKTWRCVWDDGPGEDCVYHEGSWQYCWCGPGGNPFPCDCLLEGTPITLADGSSKLIEKINVGDLLLSYSGAVVGGFAVGPTEVTTVHTPILVDRYLLINDEIRITESHPMLSGGEWSAARDLRVGDNLTAPDGSVVPIVSIRQVNQMTLVYTFETSSKNYIAHGVVVHNKENCLKYAYDGP